MTLYSACYPCSVLQIARILNQIDMDDETKVRIQRRMLVNLSEFDPQEVISAEMLYHLQREIERETGLTDPLAAVKARSTHDALQLLPELRQKVHAAADPLETALRISLAGNTIDTGLMHSYDLAEVVQRALDEPLSINHIAQLKAALEKAEWVLMLADNAGETVFDLLLVEALGKRVVYAVKEKAVANDATMEDARAAGLHEAAELISSGSAAAGTDMKFISPQFKELLFSAPLVISKGMANFETLWQILPSAFFLLQVKCPVNAGILGVAERSFVIAGGEPKEAA